MKNLKIILLMFCTQCKSYSLFFIKKKRIGHILDPMIGHIVLYISGSLSSDIALYI